MQVSWQEQRPDVRARNVVVVTEPTAVPHDRYRSAEEPESCGEPLP